MSFVTIGKEGYTLKHRRWTERNANGWEFEAFKPDGKLFMAGTRVTDNPDELAAAELDDIIEADKMCLANDKIREAAPWVKHKKSGCEIKIYGTSNPNRSNCFTYIIRKDGKELYGGSTNCGKKRALENARSMIRSKKL